MKRRVVTLLVLACALTGGARAQTQEQPQAAAPAAAPKIAISSLVGDSLTITFYRGSTGTNMGNASSVLKMPGPLLDVAVLKVVQEALAKAAPEATVFPLKVAVAGSSVDPAAVVVDDKVVAGNVLVDSLRQQGFTHLLTATRYAHNNVIRLAEGRVASGKGALEGLGFYLDNTLKVENLRTGERSEGIVAPYAYIQLRLVDLATLGVRTQFITANSVAAAAQNKTGSDAWGSLTPEEKMTAVQSLIKVHVAQAVPNLFAPR